MLGVLSHDAVITLFTLHLQIYISPIIHFIFVGFQFFSTPSSSVPSFCGLMFTTGGIYHPNDEDIFLLLLLFDSLRSFVGFPALFWPDSDRTHWPRFRVDTARCSVVLPSKLSRQETV